MNDIQNIPTPITEDFVANHDFQPTVCQCLNHASRLERQLAAVTEQRDELHDEVAQLEVRHAATMIHTQSVVDERNKAFIALEKIWEFLEDDYDYGYNTPAYQGALNLVKKTINEHKYKDITPTV